MTLPIFNVILEKYCKHPRQEKGLVTIMIKKRSHILFLSALTVTFLFLISFVISKGYVYGSKTDWLSQHAVIPDYFRQYFYDTGKLIPEFSMNFGAGQNFYNFSFYSFLSPVTLISYLFPSVSMVAYIQISSVVLMLISSYLLYYWLYKKGYSYGICVFCTVIFAFSSPLLYHFHKQVIFVQNLPFILLNLMAVDRFFASGFKKRLLHIWSIFFMIMINYYFSISAIVVTTIYAVYVFLCNNENFKFKDFLHAALSYALNVITAILMAGVLLIPTFLGLLNGRVENPNAKVSLAELLIPQYPFHTIHYSAYGLGLTSIVAFAVVALILSKKKPRIFLGVTLILVFTVKFFIYILNGGLYPRSKVIVCFLPVVILVIAMFLKDLYERRISIRTCCYMAGGICAFILLNLIITRSGIKNYFIFADFGITLYLMYISQKEDKKIVLLVPVFIIMNIINLAINISDDDFVPQSLTNNVYAKERLELVNRTIDKDNSFFRINDLENYAYNCNLYYNLRAYNTSIYSSVYNTNYNKFVRYTINCADPSINDICVLNTSNAIFQNFMGVKYIVTSNVHAPSGYELIDSSGKWKMYKNDNVMSLGFATDNLMSETEFYSLSYHERALALLNNIVVNNDNIKSDYEIKFDKLDFDINFPEAILVPNPEKGIYHISTSRQRVFTVPLPDTDKYDLYVLNIEICERYNNKVRIRVNNITNGLSHFGAAFPNNNFLFQYVISDTNDLNELEIAVNAGDFNIESVELYGLNYGEYSKSSMDMMTNIAVVDNNVITGEIDVQKDGYFTMTIPYADGFTLYVDGKESKIEMTDTAFIGTVISKGHHDIKLVYHTPGLKLGYMVSALGAAIFIILMILEAISIRRR